MRIITLPIIVLSILCILCNNKAYKNLEKANKKVIIEDCKSPSGTYQGDTVLLTKLQVGDTLYLKFHHLQSDVGWFQDDTLTTSNFIKLINKDVEDLEGRENIREFTFTYLVTNDKSFLLYFQLNRPWEKSKRPLSVCFIKSSGFGFNN